jgi:hypothetical protein
MNEFNRTKHNPGDPTLNPPEEEALVSAAQKDPQEWQPDPFCQVL